MAEGFGALIQSVLVGIHAPRELDLVAVDADGMKPRNGLGGRGFSGFVGIEGKSDAFDPGGTDRLENFFGEVGGAKGAGGGFHAILDEGQGIEDAFGEDDFP